MSAMIQIEEIIDAGMVELKSSFAEYYMAIEPVPDQAGFFQASVYGVELDQIEIVTRMIHDVDASTFRSSGYFLIPMVVDIDDTIEYYPEIAEMVNCERLASTMNNMFDFVYSNNILDYVQQPFINLISSDTKIAADTELALAA